MIALDVNLNGDNCWPDLPEKEVIEAEKLSIGVLDGGTASGKPSVTLRIDLPDGRVVLAQTTARLFCTAANMITGKYPDLFE